MVRNMTTQKTEQEDQPQTAATGTPAQNRAENENVINEIIVEGAKLAAKQSYIRSGLIKLMNKINETIPQGTHIPYSRYVITEEDTEKYGLAWIADDISIRLAKYSTWDDKEKGNAELDIYNIRDLRKAIEELPTALEHIRDRIIEVKNKTEHAEQVINSMLEALE